jgi:protein farnesyltransferase/geranylgeranyltransferase type-1 subunit alpha
MDYFRAVLQAEELSERALALVDDVVALNPANYTAWQYRRELLRALGKDLRLEFDYTEAMALEHAKNYQIWCGGGAALPPRRRRRPARR